MTALRYKIVAYLILTQAVAFATCFAAGRFSPGSNGRVLVGVSLGLAQTLCLGTSTFLVFGSNRLVLRAWAHVTMFVVSGAVMLLCGLLFHKARGADTAGFLQGNVLESYVAVAPGYLIIPALLHCVTPFLRVCGISPARPSQLTVLSLAVVTASVSGGMAVARNEPGNWISHAPLLLQDVAIIVSALAVVNRRLYIGLSFLLLAMMLPALGYIGGSWSTLLTTGLTFLPRAVGGSVGLLGLLWIVPKREADE